jgi:hypothetical protein
MNQFYKPMVGLNVYLEPYFRSEIIEKVYANIPELSDEIRRDLIRLTKDELKVPGFRNPMLAPLALRIRAAEKKFEKDSNFVKQILASWSDLHRYLLNDSLESLKTLGFNILDTATEYPDPENAFYIGWPEGINYKTIHEELSKNPDNKLTSDENSLLCIWLTGYLP